MPLIVSQHIPKTAGTTLMRAFQNAFGARFCDHNGDPDRTYTSSYNELSAKFDILHGHINLKRASHLITQETFILTFLRDPVQRVISSYYFHARPETQNVLAKHVQSNKMSLKEFANMPSQQNLQSAMVRPIGRQRIDFVGISEDFENSLIRLGNALSIKLKPHHTQNVNPSKDVKHSYQIDNDLTQYILEKNLKDLELYNWATQKWATKAQHPAPS